MKFSKHLLFTTLAAVPLLAISASQTGAQVKMQMQVQGGVAGGVNVLNGANIFGGGGGHHTTTDPKRMSLFLEMYIEEMQAVCDLSDGQAKKLGLAGKSTAQKLFSKGGMKINLARMLDGAKAPDVDEDSLSDEDKETQESDEPKKNSGQTFDIKLQVSLNQVTGHSLWKKAIKSVLSEEQQATWTEAQSQKRKSTRELVVNHRVAQLAQQLLLLPEQVAAVAEIVGRVEGDQLVKDFNNATSSNIMRVINRGKKQKQKNKVSEEDLKDVLTAVQMKVWKPPATTQNGVQGVFGKALGLNPAAPINIDVGVEFDSGLEVRSIAEKSLAASLGIQVGDVIDLVDGEPVDTALQFESAMKKAGKNASVTVLRDNAEVHLEKK